MKKRRLKGFVKKSLFAVGFVLLSSMLFYVNTTDDSEMLKELEGYEYVNSSIMTNNIPVVKEEDNIVILKPYSTLNVEISKKFYDQSSTDEEKEKSLIYYNDTYIQNSGILYKSNEPFEIVNILDGTVVDVKKDEILGNVIQIKHNNDLISTYSGLSEVNVKKNQLLKQGEIIGKSGKLSLGEQLENSLLFEIIKDGKYVNPLNYIDKKLSEI